MSMTANAIFVFYTLIKNSEKDTCENDSYFTKFDASVVKPD